ncbi:hypothetical protein [Bacillus sp. FSL K6-3431]|uniref:hypothetical protein n=1 Tax=Bacillus sp. FSL K6-3431 TaxID=2921500 RepID=UPI0030FBCE90
MKKLEDHELEDLLTEFSIEYPDEEEIEQTIMQLHQYVPNKKKNPLTRFIPTPLRNAFIDSLQFSRSFWISNLVYLAIGLSFVFLIDANPYMTLFYLAPLPVLIGLIDIFRSRDEGMIELELSFKFSHSDLILSKLTIVGIFNLACTLFLIIVFNIFAKPLILIDLLQYWAAPYTAIIALSLFLSINLKTIFAVPILIATFLTLGSSVYLFINIDLVILEQVSFALFVCAIIGICLAVKLINKGAYHEFNN